MRFDLVQRVKASAFLATIYYVSAMVAGIKPQVERSQPEVRLRDVFTYGVEECVYIWG